MQLFFSCFSQRHAGGDTEFNTEKKKTSQTQETISELLGHNFRKNVYEGDTLFQSLEKAGSVKRIKEMTAEELSAVIGNAKARITKNLFSEK